MPPCAQALEPEAPAGEPASTVTGQGASFSAVKSPAMPAPTTSAPGSAITLSIWRVM